MYNSYEGPTVLGISEKWERVLCYALGWVTGIIFLIIEQRNQNVRRHAVQSILVFGALSVIGFLVSLVGGWLGGIILIGLLFRLIFGLLGFLVWAVTIVLWLGLMVMAYSRPDFILPLGPRYRAMVR